MPRQQDQDRRVRRTKKRLRDALAALMREKDLGEITVRELTDLADVNRGTFYTHYRDLEDLRRQVGQELFEELSAVLAGFQAERIRAGSTPAGLQAVLTEVFDFVAENRELFVTILGYGEMEFHTQLRVLIYRMYLREWNGLYRPRRCRDHQLLSGIRRFPASLDLSAPGSPVGCRSFGPDGGIGPLR